MKNLIELLIGYLIDDYTEDEIIKGIKKAEISFVTENGFSVKWESGVEEHLRLNENGELYEINQHIVSLLPETPDDRIVVGKNGELFEGTRDMFRDCFFDNATNKQIISWCRKEGVKLVINGVIQL